NGTVDLRILLLRMVCRPRRAVCAPTNPVTVNPEEQHESDVERAAAALQPVLLAIDGCCVRERTFAAGTAPEIAYTTDGSKRTMARWDAQFRTSCWRRCRARRMRRSPRRWSR